jgi:hypothetical protein
VRYGVELGPIVYRRYIANCNMLDKRAGEAGAQLIDSMLGWASRAGAVTSGRP